MAAFTLLLTATACSSDETTGEPDAGSRASDGAVSSAPATSDEVPATGGSNVTDDGEPTPTPAVPEGPGGAGTGWVMADQLDTNAPVDSASLPDGVSVEQVADARQAWNGREALLEGRAAPCKVVGSVWIAVTGGTGDEPEKVVIGGQDGKAASCDAHPLMSVDAESSTVLTGAEFAALL